MPQAPERWLSDAPLPGPQGWADELRGEGGEGPRAVALGPRSLASVRRR